MNKKQIRRLNWGIFTMFGILGLGLSPILHKMLPNSDLINYLIPLPGGIGSELLEHFGVWIKALGNTFLYSMGAIIGATILGFLIGALSAFWKLWIFEKISQLIWSIPLIAISVYLMAVLGLNGMFYICLGVFLGFYPIAKHTFDECMRTYEGILALKASFALTRTSEFRFLRVPIVLSRMSTAFASTVTLCIVGVTMGEYFVGTQGLGSKLKIYSTVSNKYAYLWCDILLMMLLVFVSSKLSEILWEMLFPSFRNSDEELT